MTRSSTTALNTAFEGDSLSPFFAVELEFPDETLNYWTGYGSITFDSKTFTGAADFLSLDIGSESTELQAIGATLVISSIAPANIALALTTDYQGSPLRIWFGALTTSGGVIADPYMVFEGKMDTMTVTDGSNSSTLAITAESNLIDLNRTRVRRYTDQDQKERHPTDRGFEYVVSVQDMQIPWGRSE